MKLRVNDALATAISQMIDQDSPLSHDDLDTAFTRFKLRAGDPGRVDANGKYIGKHRRVKGVLTYAVDNEAEAGGRLIEYVVARLQGAGSFRDGSSNRLPADAVANAQAVFRGEGLTLTDDGSLVPTTLDGLTGTALTEALLAYVRRARAGVEDAALLTGTAKDLVEATARHVLEERAAGYSPHMPFPGTVFQAFNTLGFSGVTGNEFDLRKQLSSDPIERFHQCVYLLAVVVNDLRNAQGTGHGRPFPATVSARDARAATQAMGLVAGLLLESL
jgi:hypothetical protein